MSTIKIIRVIDFIVPLHANIASYLSLKINHSVYPCLDDKPPLIQLLIIPEQDKGKTGIREKLSQNDTTIFTCTAIPFQFHFVLNGLSDKGETDCNLTLFSLFFFFFILIKMLL